MALEPLELEAGFLRRTTVVRLSGAGCDGVGEDVGWDSADHAAFQRGTVGRDALRALAGRTTLDGFARRLDDFALLPEPQGEPEYRLYRRWAFESAALDLALRQAGRALADVLELQPAPVRFVTSGGLGSPASIAPLERRLAAYPDLEFKLDWSPDWTPALIEALARLDRVRVVDLKGWYRSDTFSGPEPDAAGYRAVAAGLPDVWIEDARLGDPALDAALAPARERITWDAPLHALADLVALPFKPRAINVKPSRFGALYELFRVYDYCRDHEIAMYGGGQFELGPGRGQIQYLASLFHPDGANDVAPVAYHAAAWPAGLPTSPLPPACAATGFRRDGAGA